MFHVFGIEKLNEQFAEFIEDNPINISDFEIIGRRIFITYKKEERGTSDLLVNISLVGPREDINKEFEDVLADALIQKEETHWTPRKDGYGPYAKKIILYSIVEF